jgi:hypothetical protein
MTTLIIILTLLTVGIFYLQQKKKATQNDRAIGQKVILKYADQNDSIAKELPRTGIIKGKIKIEKTTDNFVVKLDRPINFENDDFYEIVVKHRHVGQYIGSTKEIDVHLLMPRVKLVKDKYLIDDFSHVAWLTLKTELAATTHNNVHI